MRKPVEKLIIKFFFVYLASIIKKGNVLIKIIKSDKKMYRKITSGT